MSKKRSKPNKRKVKPSSKTKRNLAVTTNQSTAQPAKGVTIHYFDNVYGDKALLQEHRVLLEELLEGKSLREKRLRLKRMRGHRIYTIDLDNTDRLLFGELHLSEQRLLILFGQITNHRYDHSLLQDKRLVKMFWPIPTKS